MLDALWKFFLASTLVALLITVAIEAPEVHRVWLRNKVASKVFKVEHYTGGGTGFAVKAPSGRNYIVTNAHVCDGLSASGAETAATAFVGGLERRILEISDVTDLCLIEGLPDVEGLSLGGYPSLGDIITVIGFPGMGGLTMTVGEIKAVINVTVFQHFIEPDSVGRCDLKKHRVVPSEQGDVCVAKLYGAYDTTAHALPGSSGSPAVDRWGRVIGVVFAIDIRSNWATVVNLGDLKDFLAKR